MEKVFEHLGSQNLDKFNVNYAQGLDGFFLIKHDSPLTGIVNFRDIKNFQ